MSKSGSIAPLQGIGRAQSGLLIAETSFEVIAALSGSRFDFLSFEAKLEQEHAPRIDKREAPGVYETICRKQKGTWALDSYLLPSGTAGTPPDISDLLIAAGFTHTNTPATSDAYTLRNGLDSFSLLRDSENVSELLHGCLAEELKISFDGTAEAKLSLSGKAADVKRAGVTTLAAPLAALAATATLVEAEYYDVGAYIQFDGDPGPYKITTIDLVTNVIGISPVAAIGAANGSTVSPTIPAGATAGSPVCGNFGSLVVGGNTLTATSGSVTCGWTVWTTDGVFGRNRYSSNFALVERSVKFELSLYADNINLLEYFRSRATHGVGTGSTAMTLALGTIAGSIVEVSLPYSQFDLASLTVPDADGNMLSLAGTALANAGNDELVLTYK